MLHLLLADEATKIATATSLESASVAYFVARGAYYAQLDETGSTTEAEHFAWEFVLDEFDGALARFSTPVTPLVVFG